MAIGNAEFAREKGRPTPQDVHRSALSGVDTAQAAHGEAQGKTDCCTPGTRKRTRFTALGLHLMEGGGVEACSDTPV